MFGFDGLRQDIDDSVHAKLMRQLFAQEPEKGETLGKRVVDLATNLLLVTSQEDTSKYLKAQWKLLGKGIKFEIMFRRVESGETFQNFKRGLSSETTWREKSLFWKSVSDTLYLSQLGIEAMGKIPSGVLETVGSIGGLGNFYSMGDAKQVAETLDYLRDCSQTSYHGAKLASEANAKPKVDFETTKQKMVKASSMLGSVASLGKIAAEYSGMPSVAFGLALASGFLGGVKFLATWGAEAPGTELKRIAAEFAVAVDELKSECDNKIRVFKDPSIVEVKRNLYLLSENIQDKRTDWQALRNLMIRFNEIKAEVDALKIAEEPLSGKLNSFIARAVEAIDKRPGVIEKELGKLVQQLAVLLSFKMDIIKRLEGLDAAYGDEERIKLHIQEALEVLKGTIDAEMSTITASLHNPPGQLDISQWLVWVNETVSPAHIAYLEASLEYCSEPPSFIDDLHI